MGAARLYKTGHPYNAVDLAEVDYTQTADVVYWAHLNYPPEKLVRAGHTDWTFSEVVFGPTTASITTLAATVHEPNTTGAFLVNVRYIVSTVSKTGQLGHTSNIATASNDLTLNGNYNSLAWTADANSAYYNVYKSENDGSFGFIGIAESNSFTDGNGGIEPDYSDGPRSFDNPFDDAGGTDLGNYPSTVGLHQQRLLWARTRNKPNAVFASRVADIENMDISHPGKEDDAFSVGLFSERVNSVNELANMKDLMALTSDAIFSLDIASAQQVSDKRQTGQGSKRIKPLVIDNVLLFRPSQGSSIRSLGYSFQIDGYESNNLAIFSPHFFDGHQIIDWCFQREPYAAVWAARDDGKLLCLTFEQEQQVWGWTLCETAGTVERVACITEDGMDRVYLAVRRTLAGEESVFIERMALPLLVAEDLVNSCYLDCAVTQVNTVPSAVVTGLWHLEGETVSALADGYVLSGLVVENGQITLELEATTVTVGLPYSGEIETLPLAMGGASVSRQTMAQLVIRVEKTRGIKYGIGGQFGEGDIFEVKQRETEQLDQPIQLATRDYQVNLSSQWSDGATVRVMQDYPLPATITALFPEPRVTK